MPNKLLTLNEVANVLALDWRSIERLAEAGELRARQTAGGWQFRAAEVSNWAAKNLSALARHEVKPANAGGAEPVLNLAIQSETVAVPLHATSRASVLRALVDLGRRSGRIANSAALLQSLEERERQLSTAFPGGVAIPHPTRVGSFTEELPVVAACRLHNGIPFGDPQGALTDVFFLLCATSYSQHLMLLGRLCRILHEASVLSKLRESVDAHAFMETLARQEEKLCRAK